MTLAGDRVNTLPETAIRTSTLRCRSSVALLRLVEALSIPLVVMYTCLDPSDHSPVPCPRLYLAILAPAY